MRPDYTKRAHVLYQAIPIHWYAFRGVGGEITLIHQWLCNIIFSVVSCDSWELWTNWASMKREPETKDVLANGP